MKKRVLLQFTSSHAHQEMVEVSARVEQVSLEGGWVGDLVELEELGRVRLREVAAGCGPFAEAEPDFQFVGALVAIEAGPYRGRITWVKDVVRELVPRWDVGRTPVAAEA